MINSKYIFTLWFLLPAFFSTAQPFPQKKYPQNYFQWPVKAKVGIVANFGELRPNHYHMGLDCRTDQKQNMPVVAAADGYIAKVKIEPSGFGRAIYINHPNGLTTLYAHLNDFYPELEKYVTEQQYKLESWQVFLDIPANLFPVKQGQFIAYSGSTGGSEGPHTHFEIRDTKTDKVLNPLLFNMPIADNIAPDIYRLAMYDRNSSTYEQAPKFYPLKKTGSTYTLTAGTIKPATNKISFAITAYDRYTGSGNRNGVYEADLYEDEQFISGFQLDGIGYDETRYVNANIDYKLKNSGSSYMQHLGRLPGYNTPVYAGSDGVIILKDTLLHAIKIAVKDANGNTALLQFNVKLDAVINEQPANNSFAKNEFYPGAVNIFENSNISFYMPESCLYDSIRFKYSETGTGTMFPVYQLHNTLVPVHSYFPVKIKGPSTYKDKMVMHRFAGGKNDYEKAVYDNGWYKASFRDFGNFQLMVDTVPPVITPLGFKDGMNTAKLSAIRFAVADNTGAFSFRAMLDGKWLRFTNDKGRVFVYRFDERCPEGEHELKINATDQAGNVAEKVYKFVR